MGKYDGLKNRVEQNAKSTGGGNRERVLNFPEGTEFFEVKLGTNVIKIIPYIIKGKKHPLVAKGRVDKGDPDYILEYFVHSFVGPADADILCLKRTYGKACPVCDYIDEIKDDKSQEELVKKLKPKHRAVYNVVDLNGEDPEKIQIFSVSRYLFEKELLDEAASSKDGDTVSFANPEENWAIHFRASKESLGEASYFKFKSFRFKEDQDPFLDDWLDEAISLDDCLKVPSYEEAKALFLGEDFESDDEDEDEKDEDEKPSRRRSSRKKRSEDKDEEVLECPLPDGTFGLDTDDFDECDDCDLWKKCNNAKRNR